MQFTEKKAAEVAEAHGLPDGTIRTWRRRGAIPDKYAGEIPHKISDNEAQQQQAKNVVAALKTEKINVASLSRLAEVPQSRVSDVLRGKNTFLEADFLTLKKALNTLRNEAKKALSELEKNAIGDVGEKVVKGFFARQEISTLVLLGRDTGLNGKVEGWQNGRRSFPNEVRNEMKSALLLFLTETTI